MGFVPCPPIDFSKASWLCLHAKSLRQTGWPQTLKERAPTCSKTKACYGTQWAVVEEWKESHCDSDGGGTGTGSSWEAGGSFRSPRLEPAAPRCKRGEGTARGGLWRMTSPPDRAPCPGCPVPSAPKSRAPSPSQPHQSRSTPVHLCPAHLSVTCHLCSQCALPGMSSLLDCVSLAVITWCRAISCTSAGLLSSPLCELTPLLDSEGAPLFPVKVCR